MKLGFFSDVHGNLKALQHVHEYLLSEHIEQMYFLGDAVGYLPYGIDVLNYIKERKITCLLGNHEAMLLKRQPIKPENAEVYKLDAVQKNLSQELMHFVGKWPTSMTLHFGEKKILLVHGSPSDFTNGYVYADTDLSEFVHTDYDVIIMGHTHRPFIRVESGKTFINVGSVGLPRDFGNLSSFLIADFEKEEYKIVRTPFDTTQYLNDENIHPITKNCLLRTG